MEPVEALCLENQPFYRVLSPEHTKQVRDYILKCVNKSKGVIVIAYKLNLYQDEDIHLNTAFAEAEPLPDFVKQAINYHEVKAYNNRSWSSITRHNHT